MSTLDSNSTVAQIEAAYFDNASYEEDASTTKAAAFITACRMLLSIHPDDLTTGSRRIVHNARKWDREMDAARRWLARNSSTAARARVLSGRGFSR